MQYFYIKQKATLPILSVEIVEDGLHFYNRFNDCIENASITFTMTNDECGKRVVLCAPCQLIMENHCPDENCKRYYIVYRWGARDTLNKGSYTGEFKIDFLDGTGTLIAPIRDELKVVVL